MLKRALSLCLLPLALAGAQPDGMLRELPAEAVSRLAKSLEEVEDHPQHVWRDTPPFNPDGTVNAYVEIPRGDRRKWEFDMGDHARAINRVIPERIGGYPVNYGFVPQTISVDGDPFDALVLGPALPGGQVVRGIIVGLMLMEDEKGLDAKVVLSPIGRGGRARERLTSRERDRIATFFRHYKEDEPDGFSRVPGWGSAADGRAHVEATHAFFRECRHVSDEPCRPSRP
jgi:inorganic pyrophosphatase